MLALRLSRKDSAEISREAGFPIRESKGSPSGERVRRIVTLPLTGPFRRFAIVLFGWYLVGMSHDQPSQNVVDALSEFHKAGGSPAFSETSRACYAELIEQLHRETPNSESVDAAVAGIQAAPESPQAAQDLAAALPPGGLSPALVSRLVAMLESMGTRPAATSILGRIRSLHFPAAKQVNLYVENQTNHF